MVGTAIQGARLSFAQLLLELPDNINKFKEAFEKQEAQKMRIVASREGGEL